MTISQICPPHYLDVVVAADYAALLYSLDEGIPRTVVSNGQPERVFRLFHFELFLLACDKIMKLFKRSSFTP